MALCYRPYWKRIWIVQEIGAATALRVYWGAKSARWNGFFTQILESIPSSTDPAGKLAKLRKDRYGDSYLLANLMKVCQDSVCAEPRDKIYGFVGIAHDCQDGSLSVDYSKSLFEVYGDVVSFQYASSAYKEASKRTVHFSQLVQKLFGGHAAMQRDFLENGGHQLLPMMELPNKDPSKILNVIGAPAGKILTMGPSYTEIVANPEATKSWNVMVSKAVDRQHYHKLIEIRCMNEGFLRVLLELKDADVGKICPIFQATEWAFAAPVKNYWPVRRISPGQDNLELVSEIDKQASLEYAMISRPDNSTRNDPRLFITDNYLLGLAPPNAMVGDGVIQFDGSDTVAVLRWTNTSRYCSLVGRAAIANGQYEIGSKFHVRDEHNRRANEPKFDTLVCVDMYSLSLLTR